MKPFYLYKQNNNYYARFNDLLTHRSYACRSLKTDNREIAFERAYTMLIEGIQKLNRPSDVQNFISLLSQKNYPSEDIAMLLGVILGKYPEFKVMVGTGPSTTVPKKKTPLLAFIANFWDYENSEYVQDKIAHGQRIGQRHCYEQSNLVKYWREFFSETDTLEDLTASQLREFEKYLYTRHLTSGLTNPNGKPVQALSISSRKNIIRCGGISFGWAVKMGFIEKNPEDALTQYVTVPKDRGILSPEEARDLFKYDTWDDERYRLASLVSMITGLRLGEVQALRLCDIGDNVLYIRRSWSPVDGLKCPKNGKERKVPLPPEVRTQLLKIASQNPHKNMFEETGGFVFWGDSPSKPLDAHQITDSFKKALRSIGITEELRKERNIVFHSWRHFYATTIAHDVDERHAQMILGHETPAMTKHYADHQREKDFDEMVTITNELYRQFMA